MMVAPARAPRHPWRAIGGGPYPPLGPFHRSPIPTRRMGRLQPAVTCALHTEADAHTKAGVEQLLGRCARVSGAHVCGGRGVITPSAAPTTGFTVRFTLQHRLALLDARG